MFIPFLLGLTRPNSEDDEDNSNQRDRIVLINPVTQGMVVIEGTGLDSLLRGVQGGKEGQPPAARSAIEAMPSVEISDGDEKEECVICLEECFGGGVVKEMPCKHRFHGGCIEKWLEIHGSCPVCRFKMPVEEEDGGKKGEEERGERGRREIWVSFLVGPNRRTTEHEHEQELEERESSVSASDSDSDSRDSNSGNENE